ncbi:MAG TPA: AMP-binding protein [Candidatus Eisenbacteria bacterium]|nr:AMP-binding protein [Candidatus Eisenbacteria bacterium]
MRFTPDPVQFWARVTPDRPALQRGDASWTYGRLNDAIQESADALIAQGLGAGEHVSLEFVPAHAFSFVIAFHALQRIGLLPVPIGASLPPEERQALRKRAFVDLALTSESSDTERGMEEAPALGVGVLPPTEVGPRLLRRLDTPAALCFTSGTSGEPRGCVLTHGNFFWSALASARNLGVRAGDLWLSCLPLHHVGGLSILTRSAYYGTEVLLHDRFDPEGVLDAIDRQGVTLISLVPPLLERLLRARGGRIFPTTLRAALIGGGPCPPELLMEAAELRLKALPTYGLTEAASQVTTLSPRIWPAGLDTSGRPLPFIKVEIRDHNGVKAPRGAEGEIVVSGPTVMAAYFEEREKDAQSWDGRWFKTGDIGAWDAAGRLVVLDRRSDRMVVGGENVSPAEVERALRSHPAVLEIAVAGISSGAWGHEVAAAVVLRPGASVTLNELRDHALETLATFKLPRRIKIVRELPRSASGKLLRDALRDLFRDEVLEEKPA